VFAHAVVALGEQWELGFGARWMEDDRGQAHIEYDTVPGTNNETVPGGEYDGGTVYLMNRDTIINGGIHYNGEASFSEVTPMVSLTRHLTPGGTLDNGMFYGTISEGYLTGAFNDEINPNSPAFTPEQRNEILSIIPYGPEFVTNYEVGFKGTMFDSRLQLAANFFLMDYTDKQEVIEIDNFDGRFGPSDNFEYTQNAATVEVSGIELELRVQPWDGGFLSVDLGTLNSEYTDFFIEDLDNPGEIQDVSNRNIANRTPDWTFTASVEHAFLLNNGATITPQLGVYAQPDFEWRGGLNTDSPDHPICHQDAYSKWRVRASYLPQQGNWDASLYGYNVTDEETLLRCNPGRSGAYNMYYSAPAQWGAEFNIRFGGG
jgi:iron complex outermembrane receptor protein